MTKINFGQIVIDHCRTLKHNHNDKYSGIDIALFFVFPVIGAGLLFNFQLFPSKDVVGVLITSYSVFAALLLNLLLMIYDVVKRPTNEETRNLKIALLKEIYSNIAYSILISIAALIVATIYFICFDNHKTTAGILALALYVLSGNFVLTLLMILKRVHTLLSKEFDAISHLN